MSSERRIETSRQNGAKSLGPVTAQGKRTASQNAVRHELCTRSVTLANESEPEILSLLTDLTNVYAPEDEIESLIVTQITVYTWRLFRAFGMETDLVNNELSGQDRSSEYQKAKASLRTALAFDRAWANSKCFSNLNLYETRLRREITRLENRLETRRLRNQKRTNEPSPIIGHLQDSSTETGDSL